MKLTKSPTPYQQLTERLKQIYCEHHDCPIQTGPIAPMMGVLRGDQSVIILADSPFIVIGYVDKQATQWLFDAYGQ